MRKTVSQSSPTSLGCRPAAVRIVCDSVCFRRLESCVPSASSETPLHCDHGVGSYYRHALYRKLSKKPWVFMRCDPGNSIITPTPPPDYKLDPGNSITIPSLPVVSPPRVAERVSERSSSTGTPPLYSQSTLPGKINRAGGITIGAL